MSSFLFCMWPESERNKLKDKWRGFALKHLLVHIIRCDSLAAGEAVGNFLFSFFWPLSLWFVSSSAKAWDDLFVCVVPAIYLAILPVPPYSQLGFLFAASKISRSLVSAYGTCRGAQSKPLTAVFDRLRLSPRLRLCCCHLPLYFSNKRQKSLI